MKIQAIESVETESRFSGVKQTLLGAFYGFLIGSAFALVGTSINRILFPDLPLGMDWSLLATLSGWVILGLAVVGAIASLFMERLPSLLIGAAVAAFVALVSALFFSAGSTGMRVIVLIFTLVPMAAMCLPVVLILRWLADKHEEVLQSKQPVTRILPLVLLAIVLGAGSGYFLKMSPRAAEATRFMHQLLQTASGDAKGPLYSLPDLQNHMGTEYQLFQRASESSTEGFDIRAEYSDGYSVTCVVVVYPGNEPYLSECTSTQN
jgi:hypothetical protein